MVRTVLLFEANEISEINWISKCITVYDQGGLDPDKTRFGMPSSDFESRNCKYYNKKEPIRWFLPDLVLLDWSS